MARVSIIIPTYNVEDYLEECMESVVRQTLKQIEIICINDGSTDNSLEILKRYAEKDSRIIIVDKENGGYGIGMNIGLERATGEYIGIVEPDDFVPLNMYEDLYNKAKEFDLDFIKADFYRFKRTLNGDMELTYNHLSNNEEDYNVVFNPSHEPRTLRFIMNTWSGIYKKEFLDKYHIRHNETPGASFQDNGFYFQTFAFAERAMILDKPYYMNRRDNPNSSVHNRQKVYCINVEYDHIRSVLLQYPETWERFKGMYWMKKFSNYRATIDRIGDEYKEEYVQRFSDEFKHAAEKQELIKEAFNEVEWPVVQHIMNDPGDYYKNVVLKAKPKDNSTNAEKVKKLEKEIKKIRSSESFKIGKMVTAVPRKVKTFIKNK